MGEGGGIRGGWKEGQQLEWGVENFSWNILRLGAVSLLKSINVFLRL